MFSKSNKSCLECGDTFQGRRDKKFCCDSCRTAYNNRARSVNSEAYIRTVTETLKRNRRILALLNPDGKTRVSRDKLQREGFNFSYFTSQYVTREGAQYKYVFDQGYLEVDPRSVLLVIKRESD